MRDRQLEVYVRFEADARATALRLISDELIAEHAANPHGPHSDTLQRVLRCFRRAPIVDKHVIVATQPWQEYRIGVLTGVRGEAPFVLDDGPYRTEEEAMHAVFLKRVGLLQNSTSNGAT